MRKYQSIVFFIAGLVVVILIWSLGNLMIPQKIPNVFEVSASIRTNFANTHWYNCSSTAAVAALGLLSACLVSIIMLLAVGLYQSTEHIISPFIVLAKSSPAIAFVPVFTLLFGTGISSKVIVSAMICFFPLVMGGLDGINRVPRQFFQFSHIYSSSRFRTFWHIKRGFCTEGLLSGLKTAAPLSVVGAIVGEYVIGGDNYGIGNFIIANTQSFAVVSRYVGIVLATSLGLLFYSIAQLMHYIYARRIFIKE